MSKESAQAALNKFAEAVNTGKFELFDRVVAPNCVDHDPADGQVPGPAGYRMFFSGMRTAFPDLSVTPEIIVQDEDAIALAYTLTGTQTGPLGKIPPTGKKVKIRGMQICKFKDGKMVERWGKLRRKNPPKADRHHHRIGLNSVLLHRGHLPAPSNGTGLVKCFIKTPCPHDAVIRVYEQARAP